MSPLCSIDGQHLMNYLVSRSNATVDWILWFGLVSHFSPFKLTFTSLKWPSSSGRRQIATKLETKLIKDHALLGIYHFKWKVNLSHPIGSSNQVRVPFTWLSLGELRSWEFNCLFLDQWKFLKNYEPSRADERMNKQTKVSSSFKLGLLVCNTRIWSNVKLSWSNQIILLQIWSNNPSFLPSFLSPMWKQWLSGRSRARGILLKYKIMETHQKASWWIT